MSRWVNLTLTMVGGKKKSIRWPHPLFNPRNLAAILGIDLESLENCTVVEE